MTYFGETTTSGLFPGFSDLDRGDNLIVSAPAVGDIVQLGDYPPAPDVLPFIIGRGFLTRTVTIARTNHEPFQAEYWPDSSSNPGDMVAMLSVISGEDEKVDTSKAFADPLTSITLKKLRKPPTNQSPLWRIELEESKMESDITVSYFLSIMSSLVAQELRKTRENLPYF